MRGIGVEVPQGVGEVRGGREGSDEKGSERHAVEIDADSGGDPERQDAEAHEVGHDRPRRARQPQVVRRGRPRGHGPEQESLPAEGDGRDDLEDSAHAGHPQGPGRTDGAGRDRLRRLGDPVAVPVRPVVERPGQDLGPEHRERGERDAHRRRAKPRLR